MTELPDLPVPPSRPVSPLPNGLDDARRAGRTRRHRFLAGAGTTTALLALTAALTLGGSTRTDSLIANDPDPVATPTAESSPSPSAASTTPSPRPDATTSGGPDTGSAPGAAPSAAPSPPESGAPTAGDPPAPDPGAGADDREAYVEEPRDTSAPLQCTTTPPADAGPVFTGGASACGYASGGGEVRQGGQARVSLGSCQSRNAGDVVFDYAGGQEHEVVVTRNGTEVWRFSPTVRYAEGPHQRTIRDGRCLEWNGMWPTELADGSPAPVGRYTMTVLTTIVRADGRAVSADEQGAAAATVDVIAG